MVQHQNLGLISKGENDNSLFAYVQESKFSVSILEADYGQENDRQLELEHDEIIRFGKNLDVIVVTTTSVNTKALHWLAENGVDVYPHPSVIDMVKDRFILKKFLESKDIPVITGEPIIDRKDLASRVLSFPKRLRNCAHHNRDTIILTQPEDIDLMYDGPSILEDIIPVSRKEHLVIWRDSYGVVECYSPFVMRYFDNKAWIDAEFSTTKIDHTLTGQLSVLAVKIAEAFNLSGVLNAEIYVSEDGSLFVNDISLGLNTYYDPATQILSTQERKLRGAIDIQSHDQQNNLFTLIEPLAARRIAIEAVFRRLFFSGEKDITISKSAIQQKRSNQIMAGSNDDFKLMTAIIRDIIYNSVELKADKNILENTEAK